MRERWDEGGDVRGGRVVCERGGMRVVCERGGMGKVWVGELDRSNYLQLLRCLLCTLPSSRSPSLPHLTPSFLVEHSGATLQLYGSGALETLPPPPGGEPVRELHCCYLSPEDLVQWLPRIPTACPLLDVSDRDTELGKSLPLPFLHLPSSLLSPPSSLLSPPSRAWCWSALGWLPWSSSTPSQN